ncbi:hypothetical protein EJD97_001447 [Solanum chilense]|uniref:Gag-pol polyprotein n=1 Tax=Solanum chilense TaxID=4083 RepID=A0A6N2APF5_SOLCI|nr:hypothetical protein EJD97_001447 [Solanum chilense]
MNTRRSLTRIFEDNDVHEEIPPQVEQVKQAPQGSQGFQGDHEPIVEGGMTTQPNLSIVRRVNVVESTMISRLRDLVRMNTPIYLGSKVGEDPQEFLHGMYKVLSSMEVSSREKVELASYHLRDVSQIWYTRWKDNRPVEASFFK